MYTCTACAGHSVHTMTSENHKLVIGSLLNAADSLTKKVISAYSPLVKYQTNLQNIRRFNADHIEATALFLGFKIRADDKKLYKNLQILSDRIILKIESLFESICTDCGETYSNSLSDKPPLSCYLCMQGSHDCSKVKEKIDPGSRPPAGSVWLCSGCLKKNDLALVPNVTDLKSEASSTPVVANNAENSNISKDTGAEEEDTEERVSPRRNRDGKEGPICAAYRKRECPHGLTGKRLINDRPCPYRHPPHCYRWSKHGDNKKLGCTKGSECRYFHPKLCRNSVSKRECLNRECTYVHLKHTRRTQETNTARPQPPPSNKTSQRFRFDSVSTMGGSPYAPTVQKRNTAPDKELAGAIKPGEETNHSNSFLLKLIESMKEGIILQMSEKLLEFQASIPDIVREELNTGRQTALQAPMFPPPQYQQQISFAPTALRPQHLPAGIQKPYPGYSY